MEIGIKGQYYIYSVIDIIKECDDMQTLKEKLSKENLFENVIDGFLDIDEITDYTDMYDEIKDTADTLGLEFTEDDISTCYNMLNKDIKKGLENGVLQFYNLSVEYYEDGYYDLDATVDYDLEKLVQEVYDKSHSDKEIEER